MTRICIALILASAVGAEAAQTMYRCTDARGRTSFSDRACPGQAAAPVQSRSRLEADCAQGSQDACTELRQASKPARSPAKADVGKSRRKRSAD
jgi:uncharacterized protein DUF4124